MPNLLAYPTRWSLQPGEPDPWNGTSYVFTSDGDNAFDFTQGGQAVAPGDTYVGAAYTSTAQVLYLNLVSADGLTVLQSLPLTEELAFFNWHATGTQGARFVLTDSATGTTAESVAGYNITLTPDEAVSYNCQCDDDGVIQKTTLAALRRRLIVRLGFSAQASNPPPGMADLVDDFIRSAQTMLYVRYAALRVRRWFTWQIRQGVRFYDLQANEGLCSLKLNARNIEWAGVSRGNDVWTPITCGIDPTNYTSQQSGQVWAYEVRQCIEVWPYPSDDNWQLRIKGDVGCLPLIQGTDETSIDEEPLFLLALANAKAHYKQPDAGNYSSQVQTMMRDLTAQSHGTRRYLPGGGTAPRNKPMPRRVP